MVVRIKATVTDKNMSFVKKIEIAEQRESRGITKYSFYNGVSHSYLAANTNPPKKR
jgi:hypothetical protein